MYIQYDALGNICATVITSGTAPECANQITVDDGTPLDGMMVDTVNLVLVPTPVVAAPAGT